MSKSKTMKVESKTRIYFTIGDEQVFIDPDDADNLITFLAEQSEGDYMNIEAEVAE